MKKAFFIVLLILNSCGWIDNDKISYNDKIVENIILTKQENNNSVNLMFKENEDFFSEIVSDCTEVYFNSTKMEIYVKKYLNKFNNQYYKIIVLNNDTNHIFESINKKKITQKNYELYVNTHSNELKKWSFKKKIINSEN